jgi:hypothetical protein
MLLRLADALGTAPERLVTDTVARLREEAAVKEPNRR